MRVTDRIGARVLARTTKHKPADGSTHWPSRKLGSFFGERAARVKVGRVVKLAQVSVWPVTLNKRHLIADIFWYAFLAPERCVR